GGGTAGRAGLTIQQGRENIRGAFRVQRPEAVYGRDVLLVDDVLTTGTTVSECARILHRAGGTRVWVATVARTLKHETSSQVADELSQPDKTRMSMAAHG